MDRLDVGGSVSKSGGSPPPNIPPSSSPSPPSPPSLWWCRALSAAAASNLSGELCSSNSALEMREVVGDKGGEEGGEGWEVDLEKEKGGDSRGRLEALTRLLLEERRGGRKEEDGEEEEEELAKGRGANRKGEEEEVEGVVAVPDDFRLPEEARGIFGEERKRRASEAEDEREGKGMREERGKGRRSRSQEESQ